MPNVWCSYAFVWAKECQIRIDYFSSKSASVIAVGCLKTKSPQFFKLQFLSLCSFLVRRLGMEGPKEDHDMLTCLANKIFIYISEATYQCPTSATEFPSPQHKYILFIESLSTSLQ